MTVRKPPVQPGANPLQELLNRFPDNKIIDALMADAGPGYRPCIPETSFDSEILACRKQLTALQSIAKEAARYVLIDSREPDAYTELIALLTQEGFL